MARFRKTAIAAAAVSALALAPTAAYADLSHRGVSASSEDRGMSWGHYSGKVTDFTTTPDIFKDARASAVMIGLDGRSFFRLRVTGIDASDGVYGVHLHQGPCIKGDSGAAALGHYNVTWDEIAGEITGDVSNKTEVWLDLDVNSAGEAGSTATVSFIPEGDRSIVLHAKPTLHEPDGAGHDAGWADTRLACLPFKINVYGTS